MQTTVYDSDDDYQSPAESQFSNLLRFVVYLTQILDTVALTMFMPIFPYYFKHLNDYDPAIEGLQYGMITAAFALGRFFGNTILGMLSDKYGRRTIILAGSLATTGLTVWTAFAPSIVQLSISRLLSGFTAGTSGALASYIADVTSIQDRAKEMGRIGACGTFGIMVGPSLGIIFGYTLGVEKGFFAAALAGAGMGGLNFFAVLFFLKESPRFDVDDRSKLKTRKVCLKWSQLQKGRLRSILIIFAASFFNAFSFIFLETVMPLLLIQAYKIVAWKLIIVFAVFLITGGLMQGLLFARLVQLFGDIRDFITVVACVCGALIFVIPVVENYYYVLFILMGCSICVMMGPAYTVMASYVAGGKYGTVLGLRSSIVALARAISPLVNGPAYDVKFWDIYPSHTTHILPFILCSLSIVLSGILIRFSEKSHFSTAVMRPETESAKETDPLVEKSIQ